MSEVVAPPKVTEVESHGVEPIPDAERTARPIDLFRLVFGGANTFATVVLGSFPILFGLSFRSAVVATLLGVIVGAVILAPMAVFGPRNGTNNAVSSSAHLGVHGRVVGSFLSLLTALAFFSISVWSSGDVLIGAAHRAFSLPKNDLTLALSYGIFALLVLTVCIYGFRFMLLVNKIAVAAATLLFLLGVFAFAGDFDGGYAGSIGPADHALYWPAFVGAALVVMSNPISFGAFLGDWSRYIPRETPRLRVMAAAFLAQIATLVPFGFGLVTATVVATEAPKFIAGSDYVGGLLAVSPDWYFVPVCLIAMIIGWFVRRGWYDSDSLQVFNRRQQGGRYWFRHGWNWRGLVGWLAPAALSLCFVNIPGQFVGWFGNVANGVDLSIPIGIGLAAVLYPVLLFVVPEPADAFGPEGPRLVPAGPAADNPIVDGATPAVLVDAVWPTSTERKFPWPSARSTVR